MNTSFLNIQTSETPQINLAVGIILSVLLLFFMNGITDHRTVWDLIKPLFP